MQRFDMIQGSQLWFEVRRGVPTASCFDQIITPTGKPSASAVKYACELVGQLVDPDFGVMQSYESAAMKNGKMIEPEARRWYEFDAGEKVEQVGFCLTDDGRFGSSPDSLVGEDGCIELKAPLPKTHAFYLLQGVVPPEYLPQVHGHLLVTGRKWCDFMSYHPAMEPLRIRVYPDAYTEALRGALEAFWTQYQNVLAKLKPVRYVPPKPAQTLEQAEAAMFTGR